MLQFFKDTNLQLIPKRKVTYILSAAVVLLSIGSLILHGGPKYNIDFTGGTTIQLKFQDPVEIQDIRAALSAEGFKDSEIKHFGSLNEISIHTGLGHSLKELSEDIENVIAQALPENPFIVQRVEQVGPKIGHELIIDALLAVFWAMVLILIYIMWRFEFKFSIGAITALLHDVIITLGIFSVFEIEVSAPIIAAVLTIVGYSLNDTIVVFDRIRENLKTSKKSAGDLAGLINGSINETLSRTVVTSGTTLLIVLILYFFGGEVLKSFALAIIIGIVVGTYSSIFVASPIVLDWKSKKA